MMECCSQYSYLFSLGTVFAFATSFGIGANDVANCFATSVGSESLKMWQAVLMGASLQFLGALFLGGGVADTVSRGIVDPKRFAESPEILMVGMVCALGSAAGKPNPEKPESERGLQLKIYSLLARLDSVDSVGK